jgi:hypothetical protein
VPANFELFGGELRLYLTSTLYKLLGSQPFYTPAPGFETQSQLGRRVGPFNLTEMETIGLQRKLRRTNSISQEGSKRTYAIASQFGLKRYPDRKLKLN